MGQITISGSTVDEVINLAMSMKNASVAVASKTPTPEASATKAVPPVAGVPKGVPTAGVPKAPVAGVPPRPTAGVPKSPAVPTRTAPPKKKGLDIEDVRANQNAVLKQEGGKAFVKETLSAFGVSKLSELDEEMLAEYNDALATFAEEEEEF